MNDRITYVSSKLRHRDMWLASGIPTISTWIHGEELPAAECSAMWDRYRDELSRCDSFVMYVEPDDQLKGCMLELGLAFAYCRQIIIVWPESQQSLVAKIGTIVHHEAVTVVDSLEKAVTILSEKPEGI